MKLCVFAVYDSKVRMFAKPLSARTIEEGRRAFKHISTDKDTEVCASPSDYTLFYIADFDQETGELQPLPNGHVSMGTGLEAQAEWYHEEAKRQMAFQSPGADLHLVPNKEDE